MMNTEEFLQQVRLDYYRELSEKQQAEIERLTLMNAAQLTDIEEIL